MDAIDGFEEKRGHNKKFSLFNNIGTKIVNYLNTNGFNIDCSATNNEGERQKTLICV